MHTVNNKLFENFDHLCDIEDLIHLKPFVSAFIAKNSQYVLPTKFAGWSFSPQDQHKKGIEDALNKYISNFDTLDNNLKPVVKDLIDNDCFGSFSVFEEDIVHTAYSFNVRYNTHGLQNKHLSTCVAKRPNDSDFDFFYNWLDKQNIFSDYGRVVFFINYPGSCQIPHYDPMEKSRDQPDEFIWINFNPNRKKFYLLNHSTNEKHYAQGHVNWFDTDNFHGADIVDYACYALRVDGTFSDQFKARFMNSGGPKG